MSTEQIIQAIDVSEKSREPTPWTPVVLKHAQMAAPLLWDVPSEKPAPQPQRTASEPESRPEPESVVQVPLRADASLEEMVDLHPTAVARAVETVLEQDKTKTGLDQVAVLLIGLGDQRAAQVLRSCSELDATRITKAVANRETITEIEKKEVFEAFRQRLLSGDVILHGGVDFARAMLRKAFGPKQGDAFLSRALPEENSGFNLIRKATVDQLLPGLQKEHPQAIALILSQLNTNQAAGVLDRLPPELQADVAYRIATMDTISPQVMRDLENSLVEELHAVISGQMTELGGPKTVAEILSRTGDATEKAVFEHIDKENATLAEEVQKAVQKLQGDIHTNHDVLA